ncbi:MAG: hypothetical protein LW645_08555 [Verrucomicrobiaceae bacterium]|nr:hypothetical protein [Verrucomicrobiaceae bacterium]
MTAALMLDDDELIARLVKERRVSRWMVKRLHIFTLGRPDVFPKRRLRRAQTAWHR